MKYLILVLMLLCGNAFAFQKYEGKGIEWNRLACPDECKSICGIGWYSNKEIKDQSGGEVYFPAAFCMDEK